MRSLVFISGGLGDALVLLPLLNELKRRGDRVTGVFSSAPLTELFVGSDLFEEEHVVTATRELPFFGLRRTWRYGQAYLPFLGARHNFWPAILAARRVVVSAPGAMELMGWRFRRTIEKLPNVRIVDMEPGCHVALQALRMVEGAGEAKLTEEAMSLPRSPGMEECRDQWDGRLQANRVCVQISAGNNVLTHKNWGVAKWGEWLAEVSARFPALQMILLGDKNEVGLADEIMSGGFPRVTSLVGKTSIADVIAILSGSKALVGLDGGLMHLAVSLGIPTCTIWGPSDFVAYGYGGMDSEKHEIIFRPVECRPCESPLRPNRIRVQRPQDCPDRKCLGALSANEVVARSSGFIQRWTNG